MDSNINKVSEALVIKIGNLALDCGFKGDYTFKEQAVKFLTTHDEEIRRECADKADNAVKGWLQGCQRMDLKAAILSAEPEQDVLADKWNEKESEKAYLRGYADGKLNGMSLFATVKPAQDDGTPK